MSKLPKHYNNYFNNSVLLILTVILCIASSPVLSAPNAISPCKPKSCTRPDLDTARPVCSSEGITYPNRCLLDLARCFNANITLSHRNICRYPPKCTAFQLKGNSTTSLATSSGGRSGGIAYKPACRQDGKYASAQCAKHLGYCWCVASSNGAPLAYSMVKYVEGRRVKCQRRKRKSTKRRNSGNRNKGKACRKADKALFNGNLMKIFQTEWSRDKVGSLQQVPASDLDRTILEWKFAILDQNRDQLLDKSEYDPLWKLVRRMVKPKRCAKSFSRACDINADSRISSIEWGQCLSRDGIDGDSDELPHSSHSGGQINGDNGDNDDYSTIGLLPTHIGNAGPGGGILIDDDIDNVLQTGISHHHYEEETPDMPDEDASDCLTDRTQALIESKSSNGYPLYVPVCTSDGRFKKVQCYNSTGYCWCVNEDTGKNIPGTSMKDLKPNCDSVISAAVRPMKGCPEEKKQVFHRDLIEFLNKTMMSYEAVSRIWKDPRDDQIATWSFVHFDKNKNKMLERSEWKAFKETVDKLQPLKKCGKKLPRYCDVNKDRQISMTEWLECLNPYKIQPLINATTATPSNGRIGKNPLLTILKAD